MNDDQVRELKDTGSFRGQRFEDNILETHISWLLMTKDFVFKLKKPLQFSFLDFTTLEKRKHYCYREIELNSRLCDIYLDVQEISLKEGQLYFGSFGGKAVDYAVRMKRCDSSRKMENMLERKEVEKKHMLHIAQKLVPFHRSALIVENPFNIEHFAKDYTDLSAAAPWVEKVLGKSYVKIIERAIEQSVHFLSQHKDLMQQRANSGYYRDVHGDLHSGNIFLYDDPVIFDCIEFNDSFREIDLLNELAFFCMDLEYYHRGDLSSYFMEKYLEINPVMQNEKERQLFIYYKSYRANVRAKVAAFGARKSEPENTEAQQEVARYLKLLDSYWQQIIS